MKSKKLPKDDVTNEIIMKEIKSILPVLRSLNKGYKDIMSLSKEIKEIKECSQKVSDTSDFIEEMICELKFAINQNNYLKPWYPKGE